MTLDQQESTFIPVAKFDEIPLECGKLIEVGDVEVALFRLGETVYATSNVCPHQGGPLADGRIFDEQIVCPWHQWRFNIRDGTSPLSPKLKIKTYPVKQDGDQILISLA